MNKTNSQIFQATHAFRDLQSLLSICYLAAVGIGMLFHHKKFDAFGINIFEYADVLDFLIAPFTDQIIVLFTVFSVTSAYFIYWLDISLEKKYPTAYARLAFGMHQRSWYSAFRLITSVVAFTTYLYMSSTLYGKIKTRQVQKAKETTITWIDNDESRGVVIGKTKEVVFLLSGGSDVKVIPISAIKAFDIHQSN